MSISFVRSLLKPQRNSEKGISSSFVRSLIKPHKKKSEDGSFVRSLIKSKKRKGKRIQLPDKLIIIPNPDKTWHEKWYPGRLKWNVPHPSRILLLGECDKGKTLIGKNFALHQHPPFETITVVHEDVPDSDDSDDEGTEEYDDFDGVEMLSKIPPRKHFDRKKKNLIILDDINFDNMSKEQQYRLNRLYGTWSTHRNITVISCSQRFFDIPKIVRKTTNFWVLWKGDDLDDRAMTARKIGMSSDKLNELFKLCDDNYDSLWIDRTKNSPYKIRKNGIHIINKRK